MELDTMHEATERIKKATEELKKDYERVKAELDRFLGAYTEESTMRSSREAFDAVVSVMHEVAVRQDDLPCLGCGKPHQQKDPALAKVVYVDLKPDHLITVAIELRTKTLLWANKTKEQALQESKEEMAQNPMAVIATALQGGVFVKPEPVTLETLAGVGIRPFHIIQWLRLEMDRNDFKAEALRSTQHPAQA